MTVDITNILKKTGTPESTLSIRSYLTSSSGKPTVLYCDYKAVVRLCIPNYLRKPMKKS